MIKYYGKIENPFYEALEGIIGLKPPEYCKKIFNSSELSDEDVGDLQSWCFSNSRPYWSTGIAILDAADAIVSEAVVNANIEGKDDKEI